MRSKKVEFMLPWEIYEASLADSKRLGYRNLGRYFIGLSIKSMVDDKREQATVIIANENPKEQDYLFRCLKLFMDDSRRIVAAIKTAKA